MIFLTADKWCMRSEPLVFTCAVELSFPSTEDKRADLLRLRDALRDIGISPVDIPLPVAVRLPGELRKNGFSVSLVVGRESGRFRILDISSGPVYGIALDIGTTTIECELFELGTGKRAGSYSISNPQVSSGADVLSRIHLSMSGQGGMLADALRSGLNCLIAAVCVENEISASNVYAVTVAGNTVMSHFFLGLDVSNIPVTPNIPVLSEAVFCRASDVGLCIFPDAVVYLFPNAGSYVGGDIISGMLCMEMHKKDTPVLFMDVGTNVEVTLGCRDWIMVGAGAAGPALEGGVADIGRKAEKGTISSVSFDADTEWPVFSVIGNTEPSGICGSGLIDLVSMLYEIGIIDQAGRFDPNRSGVVMRDGEPAYMLHSGGQKELVLKERELQNFLRSKAAMFAFLYVFLRSVGMRIQDIEKVYVSGALGCGINIESAVKIGMLPDIQRDRIVPVGNSSLKGAVMLLNDSSLIQTVDHLASLITYREMAEDPDLLNILQGAMFIPHTDPEMLKG